MGGHLSPRYGQVILVSGYLSIDHNIDVRLTERKNRKTCALELSPLFLVFSPFDFQNGGGLIRI